MAAKNFIQATKKARNKLALSEFPRSRLHSHPKGFVGELMLTAMLRLCQS
jgi:hypothetical protein